MKRMVHSGILLLMLIPLAGNRLNAQLLSAGGNGHSLFVCEQQSPSAWGMNSSGQLGLSNMVSSRAVPTSIDLPSVTAVSAGNNFSLFLKDDGTVWGCGVNTNGQLGSGSVANSVYLPQQIVSLSGITAIAAGSNHTLFLKNDGTVWSCGKNDMGQLGDGTTTERLTPVQVTGLTDITAIEAGGNHSLFLKSDGTVWSCGMDFEGQLGDGAAGPSSASPVQVSGLTSVTSISAGWAYSHFVKSDGTVWACGSNDYGQLGDGTTVDKLSPVAVAALPGTVKASSAPNGDFTLFLTTDGHVWSCGINSAGQFGIGTNSGFDPNPTPALNGFLEDVSDIAAGQYHALFLKTDGTLWGSGGNAYGQLGNGTFTNTLSLVEGAELCPEPAGLTDELMASAVVFPNPGSGSFHFMCSDQITEIQVYNLAGERVHSQPVHASEGILDLTGQAPGIYGYVLRSSEGVVQTGRIVIQ